MRALCLEPHFRPLALFDYITRSTGKQCLQLVDGDTGDTCIEQGVASNGEAFISVGGSEWEADTRHKGESKQW